MTKVLVIATSRKTRGGITSVVLKYRFTPEQILEHERCLNSSMS